MLYLNMTPFLLLSPKFMQNYAIMKQISTESNGGKIEL